MKHRRRGPITGLIGKTVYVPAAEFRECNRPNKFYKGKILKRDCRPGHLIVRLDDGSRYHWPAECLQLWLDTVPEMNKEPRDTCMTPPQPHLQQTLTPHAHQPIHPAQLLPPPQLPCQPLPPPSPRLHAPTSLSLSSHHELALSTCSLEEIAAAETLASLSRQRVPSGPLSWHRHVETTASSQHHAAHAPDIAAAASLDVASGAGAGESLEVLHPDASWSAPEPAPPPRLETVIVITGDEARSKLQQAAAAVASQQQQRQCSCQPPGGTSWEGRAPTGHQRSSAPRDGSGASQVSGTPRYRKYTEVEAAAAAAPLPRAAARPPVSLAYSAGHAGCEGAPPPISAFAADHGVFPSKANSDPLPYNPAGNLLPALPAAHPSFDCFLRCLHALAPTHPWVWLPDGSGPGVTVARPAT